MAWGKEWPSLAQQIVAYPENITNTKEVIIEQKPLLFIAEAGTVEFGKYQNKVPTHDPYSNPDSHIYYECACGAILDPGTKSFAALNNAASSAGWKVRFGHEYYIPYCVKCGEGVE